MRLVYKWHARMRMLQRNVSEPDVEETVRNPDRVTVLENGKILVVKDIRGEKIKIVYTVRHGSVVVITIMTR